MLGLESGRQALQDRHLSSNYVIKHNIIFLAPLFKEMNPQLLMNPKFYPKVFWFFFLH